MDKKLKIVRVDPKPAITEGMLRAIFEKYGIKSLDDLKERLDIYQALADRDYTAVEKSTYGAIMDDLKVSKRKAKVCDIFLGIAYEHFAWNDMKGEVKLTDKIIKIAPEDYEAIYKERLEYVYELKRKEGFPHERP